MKLPGIHDCPQSVPSFFFLGKVWSYYALVLIGVMSLADTSHHLYTASGKRPHGGKRSNI